jgi:hypothetical protein
MRRIQLILLMVVSASAAGSAQLPVASTTATREDVVARLMSFDRDADGKIGGEELGERMKSLVTRGDGDGDGVLDENEIRNLARTPLPGGGRGAGFPGMYQVPADSWFPQRSHIEGALADLKLESGVHADALAAVDAHEPRVTAASRRVAGQLLREMEVVLSIEQLADLQTILERQTAKDLRTVAVAHGPARVVNSVFFLPAGDGRAVRRFLTSQGPVKGLIDHFGLSPEKTRQGHAAIERYEANLRAAGETERGDLVERMGGILTAQERGDFQAALGRRSAIPMNVTFRTGVVSGAPPTRGVVSVAPPIAAPSTP